MGQHDKEVSPNIKQLVDVLAERMLTQGSSAAREQQHCDANLRERLYWHYGYLIALQDMLAMMSDQDHRDPDSKPNIPSLFQ